MDESQRSLQNPLPAFISKTFQMVNDPSTDALVSWSESNTSFIVWDRLEFGRQVLPRFFEHSNYSSFTNQLNTYAFRKVDGSEHLEFAHPDFVRDRPHLLRNIRQLRHDPSRSVQNLKRTRGVSSSTPTDSERRVVKYQISTSKSGRQMLLRLPLKKRLLPSDLDTSTQKDEISASKSPQNRVLRLRLKQRPLLPELDSPTRKTIFLDLDHTLVLVYHPKSGPTPEKYDFIVPRVINGQRQEYHVLKRPGVDRFLQTISERFEIVIFTAALRDYASPVIDQLDPGRAMISHRLYRDSCQETDGGYVKDLSRVGRDLKRVVIVDDNPVCYSLQPENGIPISMFLGDLEGDEELDKLAVFFERCEGFEDMREAVKDLLEGAGRQ